MTHILPALPYEFSALAPYLDEATMRLHHGKHHQTYVDKLNAALAPHPKLATRPLEELLADLSSLPDSIRTAVRNHGGGHVNHSIFWTNMAPRAGGDPAGPLAEALTAAFGDLASFRKSFVDQAVALFGSGWVWLVHDGARLAIVPRPNQDSPLIDKLVPLLGLDVWEHAYYLQYQNRRADYVTAWWNVVSWEDVGRRFQEATTRKSAS